MGETDDDGKPIIAKVSMKLAPKAQPKNKWEREEANNGKSGNVEWVEKPKSPPRSAPATGEKWVEKRSQQKSLDGSSSKEKMAMKDAKRELLEIPMKDKSRRSRSKSPGSSSKKRR